jgi:hypothetical protein
MIGYLTMHQTRQEDKLAQQQIKDVSKTTGTFEVCTYRIKIMSPKRMYILSGENDEDVLDWMKRIKTVYTHVFTEEEIAEKRTAWKVIFINFFKITFQEIRSNVQTRN